MKILAGAGKKRRMMKMRKGDPIAKDHAICLVCMHENGAIDFHSYGNVRVFTVDENSPGDRVYEVTSKLTYEQISDIMGESKIGHDKDERHAAVAARFKAAAEGKKHLTSV